MNFSLSANMLGFAQIVTIDMSTYKFCGDKCPQCPPGSAAYAQCVVANTQGIDTY